MAADGGCERDVVHIMNEGYWYRAWGALKSVPWNRGLVINAKKCQYKGVIVPTAEAWGAKAWGAKAWGMRSS